MNTSRRFFATLLVCLALLAVMFPQAAISASQAEPRIVGGTTAQAGDWPWAAALVDRNTSNAFHGLFCGGAYLGTQWVLTAAHCFAGGTFTAPTTDVVLGRIDLTGTGGERIHADSVIIHPQFDPSTNDNDLALLHLTQAPATSTATAVTLIPQGDPAQSEPQGLAAAGTSAAIIGWGELSEGGPVSSTLQAATVTIVSQSVLQQEYAVIGSPVTPNMLGAASPGIDSCQGDSGGPLLVRNNANTGWVEAGIVSWGRGCAEANFPGVYTRLANYTTWVSTMTASPSPPTSLPTDSVTGTGSITVSPSAGIPSGTFRQSPSNYPGMPSNYTFPDGLVYYQVVGLSAGASTTVTIRFPSGVPSGWKVFKATSNGFSDFSSHASQSGDAIIVTLTDGGAGDSDGVANGMITDPIGLAVPSVPSTSTSSSGGGGGGGCVAFPQDFGQTPSGAEWLLLALGGVLPLLRRSRTGQGSTPDA